MLQLILGGMDMDMRTKKLQEFLDHMDADVLLHVIVRQMSEEEADKAFGYLARMYPSDDIEYCDFCDKRLNKLDNEDIYLEEINTVVCSDCFEKKKVTVHCYIDQLINNEDGVYDSLGSAQLTVPREWASKQAIKQGFESLDDFLE